MEYRYFGAYFDRETDVLNAAAAIQERGFLIHDIYSPYPIHGVEQVKGFGESKITWIGGAAGFLGITGAFLFQYWASWTDWPIIVGGKPMNSWPAFVPVAFEVLVLFTGIIAVVALLSVSRLWPGRKEPVINDVLEDKFLLVLREEDASFDHAKAEMLLKKHGATETWERDTIKGNGKFQSSHIKGQL